ncbi:hypothetical protein B0H13DRAFT_2403715 [Mycena leptocephala]|nr:hypothetical protein B0H13DRAFT_2403715 [Mycena leptocephala]
MAYTHLHSSWKDHVFSEELVALIAEDKEIKQALFPPCGPTPSSANGGDEPKINAQWKLSVLLLGDKPKYRVPIAAAATAAAAKDTKANQGTAKIIRAFNTQMGETGAGIHDAQSIDRSKKNEFTTKWAAISAKCPWYFEKRNLNGQRPNLVPTGIGHRNTAVGVLIPGPRTVSDDEMEEKEEEEDGGLLSSTGENTGSDFEIEDDGAAAGSGDDYEPTPVHSESGLVEPSGCEVVVAGDEEERGGHESAGGQGKG